MHVENKITLLVYLGGRETKLLDGIRRPPTIALDFCVCNFHPNPNAFQLALH